MGFSLICWSADGKLCVHQARPGSAVVYTVLSWRLPVCWVLVLCSENRSEQLPGSSPSVKYCSSLLILEWWILQSNWCCTPPLAGKGWVPWQLQQDHQHRGARDVGKQDAAGEEHNPSVQGRGYSLGSTASSLCRFVGLCSAAPSYPGSVWHGKGALHLVGIVCSCLPWEMVCHHPSLPIKAPRGQCYQSLPIQSCLVGTFLFYHFDPLPAEDKRHHGRDPWMTTVIYRPSTFWTFFPLWFMNHFSIFEKQFINRSAPAEINNNEFIYIKGLILPVADNVWSQNLVGKQDFCWQCRK